MLCRLLFCCMLLLFAGIASAQTPESAFNRDPWPMAKEGKVKVFILAGQSNMQGHASLRTLEYLIYNAETSAEYQHWKNLEGAWTERRDVWVTTTDGNRRGNLKPGFGANEMKLGPELGFGWIVGEKLPEQVLIIKTCWGGRSVRKDFLPPSEPLPSDEELQKPLANARKKNPQATLEEIKAGYGKAYRDMTANVKEVLDHLPEHFPDYKAERGYELAGFVWFQGWNDFVDGEQRGEKYANYTTRLGQLIQDVRKEWNAPELPVVIGELGAAERGDFQAAQAAVAKLPGLNHVRFVPTRDFWEPEVEAMANKDVWKSADWPKYYNVASDRGYHYLGSGKIMTRMGKAFGEAMLELQK